MITFIQHFIRLNIINLNKEYTLVLTLYNEYIKEGQKNINYIHLVVKNIFRYRNLKKDKISKKIQKLS
jgi:hypothetical protein